jgi:hypothetical protein
VAYQDFLRAAGKDPAGKRSVPGAWARDSARHDWPERAAAWDCWRFKRFGKDVHKLIMEQIVRLTARRLGYPEPPGTWSERVEAVHAKYGRRLRAPNGEFYDFILARLEDLEERITEAPGWGDERLGDFYEDVLKRLDQLQRLLADVPGSGFRGRRRAT